MMRPKTEDTKIAIEPVQGDAASQRNTIMGTVPSVDALGHSLILPLSLERVAEALEEVKQHCPELPVMAIHWMHMNHPMHPYVMQWAQEFSGETEPAFRRKNHAIWRILLVLSGQFVVSLLYAGYLTIRLLWLRWHLRHEIDVLKRQHFDVVAKTWRFGMERVANGRDFYYGDLQQRLAKRGINLLLLAGDARGQRDWCAFSKAHVSTRPHGLLPEWCLVPLQVPFQAACRQAFAAVRLLRLAKRSKDAAVKCVALQASRECLSRYNIPFSLYYWIGKVAVQTWHPKAVITLYEGRGWEPCLRRGVKTADPFCLTIGYQHTIVLRHQLALLRQTRNTFLYVRPDVVLCSGTRTQAMLTGSHPCSTLIPFGTFRKFPTRQQDEGPTPERRTVLVVPEGYPEEEILLFNCALRTAQVLPDHRFIFRCHPVLPFEQVRRRLDIDPGVLPNVEVSNRPLITDDFVRASVVLYRGSSSVLYAVLHGLKPVYLYDERFYDIDPLFEVTTWRERVDSAQALEQVLARYAEIPGQEATAAWRDAARYVEEYTIPVTDASVDQWLSTLDQRHHRTV